MEVTLLGTGSALPSPDRLQTGVLIETDAARLLVDCGGGVVHRLAQRSVDVRSIDAVLLTHHHLDHVADLPTLGKARYLQDCPSLRVAGPPGTADVLRHLFAIDNLEELLDLEVTEHELGNAPLECAGHEITLAETTHSKQCFAYRFGDALVLSGDTAPDERVFDLADGVDTLVHECSYPDGADATGHTTPSALADGLQGIDVDRVYLTHLFPDAEAVADELRETVADRVDAEVSVAADLERFEIV